MNELIAEGLWSANESDRNGEQANVVDGLFAIARGLELVAGAIDRLGNADAATQMGALEGHGKAILDASTRVAGAIEGLEVLR